MIQLEMPKRTKVAKGPYRIIPAPSEIPAAIIASGEEPVALTDKVHATLLGASPCLLDACRVALSAIKISTDSSLGHVIDQLERVIERAAPTTPENVIPFPNRSGL